MNTPGTDTTLPWLKGALHVHTTRSDGKESPADTVASYGAMGFDFVALTDHNRFGPVDLPAGTAPLVIPGVEYRPSNGGPEMGVVGTAATLPMGVSNGEGLRAALEAGAFVALNHPTWHISHWPMRELLTLGEAHAIEVYNAVIEWLPGPADATPVWDILLTCGLRVFGIATDDAHEPRHRGQAWVMVQAERRADAIVAALKAGRFYASTGVVIDRITMEDGRYVVESPNAREIRFFADRGSMRCRQSPRGRLHFAPAQDDGAPGYRPCDGDIYVRAELFGDNGARAWTNPVFVDTERSRQLSDEFRQWYTARLPAG